MVEENRQMQHRVEAAARASKITLELAPLYEKAILRHKEKWAMTSAEEAGQKIPN